MSATAAVAAVRRPPPSAPRRYLVAPDKFKGTLTGAEAAAAIGDGIRDVDPGAVVHELPFADGGEGTIDAIVAAGGTRMAATVAGPLGEPVAATWALLDGVAFVEMAEASGLRHVAATPDTATQATTDGTGALVAAALDAGARHLVVGLGGSASSDAGFGALRVLGARFLDATGGEVGDVRAWRRIASVDDAALDARLAAVAIDLCTDVLAPLSGAGGAARVFGPQKGADDETVAELDARLAHLGSVLARLPDGRTAVEAGGAAGGLAAGLVAVLGARVRSGVDVLADLLGLDDRILGADVVVVGEGSLDAQSVLGKTPVGLARRARALGVPALAVVGTTTLEAHALADEGIVRIHAADAWAPDREAALRDAARCVRLAAAEAVRAHLAPVAARAR